MESTTLSALSFYMIVDECSINIGLNAKSRLEIKNGPSACPYPLKENRENNYDPYMGKRFKTINLKFSDD